MKALVLRAGVLAGATFLAGSAIAECDSFASASDASIRLAQSSAPSTGTGTTSSGTPNAVSTPSTGSPAGSVINRPSGTASSGTGQNSAGGQGVSGTSSTGSGNSPR